MQKILFLVLCSFTLMHGMEGKKFIISEMRLEKKFDKNVHIFEEKEGKGEVAYKPEDDVIIATFNKNGIITAVIKDLTNNIYESSAEYSNDHQEINKDVPKIDEKIVIMLQNKILAHEYYLNLI